MKTCLFLLFYFITPEVASSHGKVDRDGVKDKIREVTAAINNDVLRPVPGNLGLSWVRFLISVNDTWGE